MTREEAIDLLDNLIGMVEDNHNSDYDMALQMAIEALNKCDKIEKVINSCDPEFLAEYVRGLFAE